MRILATSKFYRLVSIGDLYPLIVWLEIKGLSFRCEGLRLCSAIVFCGDSPFSNAHKKSHKSKFHPHVVRILVFCPIRVFNMVSGKFSGTSESNSPLTIWVFFAAAGVRRGGPLFGPRPMEEGGVVLRYIHTPYILPTYIPPTYFPSTRRH